MAKKNGISKQQSVGVFIAIVLVTSILYMYHYATFDTIQKVSLTEVLSAYNNNQIQEVHIADNILKAKTKDGKTLETVIQNHALISDLGIDPKKVKVEVKDTASDDFWIDVMIAFIPIALLVFFIMFMLKQAQGSASSAFNFGKSRVTLIKEENKKVKFDDVAGIEEVKEELTEIVDFLKFPKKYSSMGAKIPRGVMLFGPPGTGKTLLARAVAGEANVPFYHISGSEFVEMFVGVGASRVRDLFEKARSTAPCIVFIDEVDAVGRQRGAGHGGGNDEREQTLNQILVEMDGFDNETNVIVMAATNRPDVLDPALLRPGRFDRRMNIDMPDIKARKQILEVHKKGKPLASGINFDTIAQKTTGFSGAELANVMNEAAIFAARSGKKTITQYMIEESIEKVLMGPEKKSRVHQLEEKTNTAYHEAGHAIVGASLKYCHPVHKITIVSRGRALGVTWFLPKEDLRNYSVIKFQHELAALLGGRAAEELTFGKEHVTTGASNDLERATKMARSMVTQYGMSEKLGKRVYGESNGTMFLGKDFGEGKNYSDTTANEIDREVLDILNTAYDVALDILKQHHNELKATSEALLDQETLSKEEFDSILGRPQACEVDAISEVYVSKKNTRTSKKVSPS